MTDASVTADFASILTDLQRTLSYKVVTKTNDPMTGDEITSYATAGDKSMVFFLHENRYIFDKVGLVEVGDAYVMATPATAIKRYDQFTVDGITYYIQNVIRRYILGTATFDYGICFKVA